MREMATRFERHVQKQVLEFLQTVLMIDDEAYRRSSPLSPVDEPDDWSSGSASGDLGAPLELRPPPAEPSPDDLDVQEVSISFGSKGLACAILSPQTTEENDEFKPAFVKTARRADALILDWNMNGDNGKTAEKLVRAVLKEDVKSPRRRLRLITVYTGEPDLQQIAERLSVATGETLKGVDISWDDEAKVAFSRGPVRVSVFAKKHVQSLAPALEGRRKSIAELPTLVVEDFSRHSTGLVTSASLSALAGIRNDAHRVLAALGPELDPAILGQRISLPHPEDVERQVEGLIVSEIQAVIQDHEVGSHVGLPRIKEWLAHHKTLPARGISSFTEITAALRLKLLSEGFSDEFFEDLKNAGSSKTRGEKMQKDSGTLLFSTTSEERALSDRLLASRMSLRSRYAKPTPVLQLGSILERGGAYAVCVQPLCDSVRITGSRAFPLLPLEVAAEGDRLPGDGMLTVPDQRVDGGYVRLRLHARPTDILMETFKATPAGIVQAKLNRGINRFRPVGDKSWRWVGDLKPDHAQRVVERLSAQFSRVGLDEAEVLRLGL
ncbi:response regulator receiver domain [Nocardioides kongjuensis]|uniref:Response receiver domain-containing protein n=3 Tax=Nocardioides kongjuensis TaxID=349522 RepID=A0A852R8Q7_9ACTN|nr:response regulator receiver domain [Nocardioides kongjuensis]NYD29367.1 hypothetical protein [Nocardioides kongjuensis]